MYGRARTTLTPDEKLSRRIVQLQRGLAPADSHRAEHHEPELRAECQRLRHVADQYRDQIERLTAEYGSRGGWAADPAACAS